jgi:hypothetical protein
MPSLTLDECKEALGPSAANYSDEQLEQLRQRLEQVAGTLYDEIASRASSDSGVEQIHWGAFIHSLSEEEFSEYLEDLNR